MDIYGMYIIVVRSVIYVLFPVIMYYIITADDKKISYEKKDYYFELALLSNLYLMTKIQSVNYVVYTSLLLNLPLFFSLKNEKKYFSIMLSIFLILYFNLNYDFNIYMLILNYVGLNVAYKLIPKNKFYLLIIIETILFVLEFNLLKNSFIYSFIGVIIYIIICFFSFYILNCVEKLININFQFSELEKEKKVKQSLFQITHEIKNPLTVCKGYLQMLNESNDISKYKKYIPIIREEMEHALLILEDFKELNKIDVVKQNMNLCALLDDVVDNFDIILVNRNIKLYYDFNDDLYIHGDYNKLKQVFLNVIKNSIEALENISNPYINIQIKIKQNNICILIKDNGSGIVKEDLNKMCDPFFTTKEKGTGLGLYISKEIIEKHGGVITYKSKPYVETICEIKIKK